VNPFRLQSMPCALHLTHPDCPTTPTRYIIRPPRLRTDLIYMRPLLGPLVNNRQLGTAPHFPPYAFHVRNRPTHSSRIPSPRIYGRPQDGHHLPRLHPHQHPCICNSASDTSRSPIRLPHPITHPQRLFLTIHQLRHLCGKLSLIRHASYHRHPGKNPPPHFHHHSRLHYQQIIYIQLKPHDKSILGRAYTYLFQNSLTQTMNPTVPIPQGHSTKELTGRRSEKNGVGHNYARGPGHPISLRRISPHTRHTTPSQAPQPAT